MGDPPRLRNKSVRPKKLWDVDRLKEEKKFQRDYGLKNMRELWISVAELKKYRREARRLLSLSEEERAVDTEKILNKLNKLGVLKKDSGLDDVLSLSVKDVLERRLQTLVLRKGLANTISQSRQLITHGFISVNGRKVSAPSYLVGIGEESVLSYAKQIDLSKKPPQSDSTDKKEATVDNAANEG